MDAAVDVGGTFTDFVVVREGRLEAFKLPSSPDRPQDVLLEGLRPFDVDVLGHGTTIATNAVLEGRGSPTALLTTRGFEDLLVISRQHRPRLYDFHATKPAPLVPREATFGLRERVDAKGRVLQPLAEGEVEELLPTLRARGIQSVAVSLLFSFLNPMHETRVRRLLGDHFSVSLSSEVLPEFREVERTSTTVLDAVIGPVVRGYLDHLAGRIPGRLWVMRSNGGLRSAESLLRRPVEALLSGPAGGVAGARYLADSLGLPNVLTLDMGGTSTDISVLHQGEPTWTTEAEIAGHPLALPVLDISTIGAGGGSVAWRDEGGALRVGPRSAGAEPGPLCYDRGGDEPTLTDANLLAGYLGSTLIGGRMPLRAERAERGLRRLFHTLDLDFAEGLAGIQKVVVSNMVRASAVTFARRGLDARDFVLVAYGGAGPMHAVEVARELEIPEVVVPLLPGAFSAYGILLSDLRLDYGRSVLRPLADAGEAVEAGVRELEEQAREELAAQDVDEEAVLLPSLDLRYVGQSYEINVPYGEDLEARFHRAHAARFGYASEEDAVEIVNVRLAAVVRQARPGPSPPREGEGEEGHRKVFFATGWTPTPVLSGRGAPGTKREGPLIVEEETATTVVDPGATVRVDEQGCLRIEVG
ncbi:MAG: hydantoinase/oxoprolinase family protein [Thermoplasmata archaeon]